MPYITTNTHSLTTSAHTSDMLAPILCTRINAVTALLLGIILPMLYIQCGKASGGSEAPLSSNIGIDVHSVQIIAVSGRLYSVESVIASSITESIYGNITAMQLHIEPFIG